MKEIFFFTHSVFHTLLCDKDFNKRIVRVTLQPALHKSTRWHLNLVVSFALHIVTAKFKSLSQWVVERDLSKLYLLLIIFVHFSALTIAVPYRYVNWNPMNVSACNLFKMRFCNYIGCHPSLPHNSIFSENMSHSWMSKCMYASFPSIPASHYTRTH